MISLHLLHNRDRLGFHAVIQIIFEAVHGDTLLYNGVDATVHLFCTHSHRNQVPAPSVKDLV